MVTIVAMIVDGKYKLNFEGVYFGTFAIDIIFLFVMGSIFS